MPSLVESVTALLEEGDGFAKLGTIMGGNADQASAAVGVSAPALIAGLANRAADDDGPAAVSGVLDGVDASAVDDVASFLDAGERDGGGGLLDAIFGTDRTELVSRLAGKADLDGSMIAGLLPVLAPLVVGTIAKRRTDDGLDDDGVAQLLSAEAEALDGDGLLDSIGDFFGGGFGKAAGAAAAVAGAGAGVGSMLGSKAGDAVEDVAGRAGDLAGEAKDSLSVKFGGAKEAAIGSAPTPVDDDRNGGLGWLWWALGAVVLVLLLAWALSTCNDEEVVDAAGTGQAADGADEGTDGAGSDSDADDTAEPDADSDSGSDSDSDSDSGSDSDPDAASGADTDGEAVDGDAGEEDEVDADAEIQAAVDAALAGSGVTGTVMDGVVTLTGTVEDSDGRDGAISAVRPIDGVIRIVDEIDVPEPAGDSDQDDAPDTGDTINDALDLDPVTFRVSSARLTDAGTDVLDEAAAFLEANPDVRVEIGGHTDSDGGEEENLRLSQRRAESVKEYLVNAGIDAGRMETKGYGEAEPKAPNDSEAAKAENRRIEFTIL